MKPAEPLLARDGQALPRAVVPAGDNARCVCWHSFGAHERSNASCRLCNCRHFRQPVEPEVTAVVDRVAQALDRLAGHPGFSGVSRDDLAAIREIGRERRFLARAVLMRPGEETTAAYLILNGTVEVHRPARGSLSELSAVLGPGHIVGEMSLLHGVRRSAAVTAASDLHVLELQQDAMLELFHKRAGLRQAFLELMHHRMTIARAPRQAVARA